MYGVPCGAHALMYFGGGWQVGTGRNECVLQITEYNDGNHSPLHSSIQLLQSLPGLRRTSRAMAGRCLGEPTASLYRFCPARLGTTYRGKLSHCHQFHGTLSGLGGDLSGCRSYATAVHPVGFAAGPRDRYLPRQKGKGVEGYLVEGGQSFGRLSIRRHE